MYKWNITTQIWVFLMTNLAKHGVIVKESDIVYDCPSKTVPEQNSFSKYDEFGISI